MFKYEANKHSRRLLIAYQSIVDEDDLIEMPQLTESILLITQNMELLYKHILNITDYETLIADIVDKETSQEDLMKSIKNYPLRLSEKKEISTDTTQSGLLAKLSLLKDTSLKIDKRSKDISEREQEVIKATRLLRGLFEKDVSYFTKHLESCLPTDRAKRETVLAQLMPRVSRILRTHANGISTDINVMLLSLRLKQTSHAKSLTSAS